MNKLLKGLFLSMLIFPLMVSAQLKGDTYAEASKKGSANVVYTYSEVPGFASKNASGKMEGVCVDLMAKFAEFVEQKNGIKLNVVYKADKPNDFTYFLSDVKKSSGGVFGLSNTTITEERKKEYNFSDPYITNVGMILTDKSVPTMTDIKTIATTFKGMTAITVKNSTNEKSLLDIKAKYFPDMQVEYVSSFGNVVTEILKNPKKFSNLDFTYYLEALKNKQPIKRHPGGDTLTEKFGIIMPLSNDWTPLLNEFMASFTSDVEYRKVLSDNLGSNALKFLDNIK